MRLWSLHPQYLDTKGLLALWREGLLAKAVLEKKTKGYTQHPQLTRFKKSPTPLESLLAYLHGVFKESQRRNFSFDATKIQGFKSPLLLKVSDGQMHYEWQHLLKKLEKRAPKHFYRLNQLTTPLAHPLFTIVQGPIASWEVL